MSDVFISYARRSTAKQAQAIAQALGSAGYSVWWDQDLPSHRAFADVIEEQLARAKAVVVIWSAEAVKSQWVRSEADKARELDKLVQLSVDGARPPMPFDQIQCADLARWDGAAEHPGWRKVAASVTELVGKAPVAPATARPSADAATAASAPRDKPSIAVLPFANITGGKDEEYFSDGMVEEIVTALSRFPALFVIASRSSLTYRNDGRGTGEIARELGVRYVLDGSVRRSGDRLRISVKLADAVEGSQILAERFDGAMDDVFALQDDVATAVAGRIAPSIEAADIHRAHVRPTSDLTAYDFYLRAVRRERDLDKPAMLDTLALLDQALARDPRYARALAFASLAHSALFVLGWSDEPEQSRRAALDFAQRALSEGPDDFEVLGIVSNVLLWAGDDIAVADAIAERALASNPGASFTWWASAHIKLFDGRPALAIEHWRTHLRLDPRSPYNAFIQSGTGLAQVLLRHFQAAIPLFGEAMQTHPEYPFSLVGLTVAYAHLGRLEEARSTLKRLTPASTRSVLDAVRDADHRELIRSGLALAGADV